MAEELASGAPISDWGGGLPPDLMGRMASFFVNRDCHDFDDEMVGYNRKEFAGRRLVNRYWASTLPLAIDALRANARAPPRSATMFDNVVTLRWNVTSCRNILDPRSNYSDADSLGSDADSLAPHGTELISSLRNLKHLTLLLPKGEVRIADAVDSMVARGTLTSLVIRGRFDCSDELFRMLSRLTSLEILDVHDNENFTVTDVGLKELSSMTSLRVLVITRSKSVTSSCIDTLRAAIEGLHVIQV